MRLFYTYKFDEILIFIWKIYIKIKVFKSVKIIWIINSNLW